MLEAGLVEECADHSLQDPDLGAQAEAEQHHEEERGPEGGPGDLGEHVSHHDEGEPGALGGVVQLLDQGAVPDGGDEVRVGPSNDNVSQS